MTTMAIEALSGLGIFLFGMLYMELALKEVAGIKFKRWIKNSTSTPLKSLFAGAGATTALQSSSVVTLMTLSFVSAGLISLESSIGVIFGSNLGTTATAWIVATLGFKVKVEAFALPLIGVGGFLLITSGTHQKLAATAKSLIGFGLLFFGLDIMKTAIESVASSIDLSSYASFPLLVFVGFGFIITALIQSSSAATAIVLSALYAQILTFEQASAMVIGTNIGTTVTALLGSIGGIPDKKRAAAAHLLFNLITATAAFLLLPLIVLFLMQTLELQEEPIIALAIFHTIFNLMGVLMLAPLIPFLAKYLKRMFVQAEAVPTKYIHLVDPKIPDTALIALRNEVSHLFVKTMKFALLLANIRPKDILSLKHDAKEAVALNQGRIDFDYPRFYENIKEIEINAVAFINTFNQQNLTPEQSQGIEPLLSSVRESVYAAKLLKDIKNNINEFAESDNPPIVQAYDAIRRNLAYTMMIFVNSMQEKWTPEKCEEKFAKAEEDNRHIVKETTLLLSRDRVKEKAVASLLNTNRSVYIAMQSLQSASKAVNLHFSLDEESPS
ncbi:MAG: Na/Pi cotransporter family protein [Campylobacterales bacterium]|nr:Na/Pi cotransporter family protein [Campylobacterales bacterium]